MKRKELAMFMQVSDENRAEFDSIIDGLIDEGYISVTQKGKLVLGKVKKAPKEKNDALSFDQNDENGLETSSKKSKKQKKEKLFQGKYIGNSRGFGFVEIEGMDEDLFVPEGMSLNALHNDIVEAKIIKEATTSSRAEAQIVNIVERSKDVIVGTYEASENFGFVKCDNSKLINDIFIPKQYSMGAVSGHKVIVDIYDYGDDRHKPEGKIVEILGHANDPGVDILSIALAFGIETKFPEKVLNQANRLNVAVSEADMEGRSDLRSLNMVTIDSEDSKDLDDAVSLEMEGEDYVLGVHIADVSNYVQENSALDREAIKRGTSTYLADRVIPMLPHSLSNGICSLNEKEDRLSLSCIMKIDNAGNVKDYDIVESVINVNRRMTYTIVNKIISEHDEELIAEYGELSDMFMRMYELAKILRAKRTKRGSIDFDFPESKVLLDDQGKAIDIKPYDRNEATKLIEEFMLMANETVASHFFWQEIPFVYRVHESPEEGKLEKFKTFIKNYGLKLKVGNEELHPKELQKLLAKIEGTDQEILITRVALRSMMQAKYSTECTGHFGLACEYYCHFTSPIRRYPDLQIHRIIKDSIRGRLTPARIKHYEDILDSVAASCSRNERKSEETERETTKLKKAEYMGRHLYEVYEGFISGVTNWGIYVELENTCEGLVHVSSMTGDYYRFDEGKFELVGESSGKSYKLGDKVKVMVHDVDLAERTVDFILADFDENDAVHDFYKNGRRG
ncbi:MAG: ribonuclease R [Lachnospiraceae bacterium]|nr:ribonuclease R [Lachnospiraceae bacterium]